MEFGSRRGSPHPELAQHLELAMWVFGPRRCPAASGVGGGDQDNKEEEEVKEEQEEGEGGFALLLKPRGPHLAGGEIYENVRNVRKC